MNANKIKHLKKVKDQLIKMGYKEKDLERYFKTKKNQSINNKSESLKDGTSENKETEN